MQVLRYEDSLAGLFKSKEKTVFLAGPTVRGNQPHLTSWRPDAIAEFEKQGFDGKIVIPEFSDPKASDKGLLWIPAWEYSGLLQWDAIMFWIPRTQELIGLTTNHEMGYWLGRLRDKIIYGRPDNSYRNTYLDLMWQLDAEQNGISPEKICTTLEETVKETIKISKYAFINGRTQSRFHVNSPFGGWQ